MRRLDIAQILGKYTFSFSQALEIVHFYFNFQKQFQKLSSFIFFARLPLHYNTHNHRMNSLLFHQNCKENLTQFCGNLTLFHYVKMSSLKSTCPQRPTGRHSIFSPRPLLHFLLTKNCFLQPATRK